MIKKKHDKMICGCLSVTLYFSIFNFCIDIERNTIQQFSCCQVSFQENTNACVQINSMAIPLELYTTMPGRREKQTGWKRNALPTPIDCQTFDITRQQGIYLMPGTVVKHIKIKFIFVSKLDEHQKLYHSCHDSHHCTPSMTTTVPVLLYKYDT